MAVTLSDGGKDVTSAAVGGNFDGGNDDNVALSNLNEYASLNAPSSSSINSVRNNDELYSITTNTDTLMGPATQDLNSLMSFTQISAAIASGTKLPPYKTNTTKTHSNPKQLKTFSATGKSCRFPKLEECAHFHYERVQLGSLSACVVDDKSELLTSSIASESIGGDIPGCNQLTNATVCGTSNFLPSNCWFIIKVFPHFGESFLIKRSFANMQMLDEMMHRCVYDRKISGLKNLAESDLKTEEDAEYAVVEYLERFSKIASDSLTCGTILTWFQLDNKGRRLPLADSDTMQSINTPAVGAAYGVRRYQAQAVDEISIEVGDMISVIDMPSPAESIWWRGKKSHLQKSHYEVGFFPQSCVAIIGDKVPRYFPMPAPLVGQLDISPTKPVLRKHGKLIAFFRSFILSRPSQRRLKQTGIYRERVFSCDLSEHLLNSGQDIPMVLKCCAEFIEQYGIVDGIYRLSGITSNIQRLRRSFDEECIPDLGNPEMKQDIHAVSSLLKMYFRELPNPLCTYQLYDNFVEAIQTNPASCERLRLMKETVLKLPPPHYRTLKYLSQHLNKIAQHSDRTSMTDKNLAIVWAPNLLRCPALESGGVAALRGVGVQAVVTEYLIRNCHDIFEESDDTNARLSFIGTAGAFRNNKIEPRMDSLTDCESLLVEQREHDQSLTFIERPKSLSCGGPKLISLEEAQERHSRFDNFDIKQSMPISMIASNAQNIGSYIEVGGGPSSLPDKYHTVLSAPRNWHKPKTNSWKSLFTRSQRSVNNTRTHNPKSGENTFTSAISPPCHKDQTQVTFVESDAIMTHSEKAAKGLLKQGKPKSVEFFEPVRTLGAELRNVSVRSNSIDSLRTTGHSRSVSHDSYFDVLQSPHRANVNSCLTRELSELGINFDREEPEMRLFSDSESLVSSPRVHKENVPLHLVNNSRRILRARPEDFSSQTNSVNPSPKKQPRLNILLSPNVNTSNQHANKSNVNDAQCRDNLQNINDENYCKRYKLEDELSDIQFIDCSTPEHTIANPQTMYASVQVHTAPKVSPTKEKQIEKNSDSSGAMGTLATVHNETSLNAPSSNTRYSCSSTQLRCKPIEQEDDMKYFKERFSYPVSNGNGHRLMDKGQFKLPKKDKSSDKSNSQNCLLLPAPISNSAHRVPKGSTESIRQKIRNSYSDNLNSMAIKANVDPTEKLNAEMSGSKISVTPCSPAHSPRYSLLMGETSSENSSCVSTPQCEVEEPLVLTSPSSELTELTGLSIPLYTQHSPLLDGHGGIQTDDPIESLTSHYLESYIGDKRDMRALKRELSLDLYSGSAKNSHDHNEAGINFPTVKQQLISPNSNFTDNTSQSVTPSEFGYQHLQRQSSMHSLLETDEHSLAYEDDNEQHMHSDIVTPLDENATSKLNSPIKSTISITYNVKDKNNGNSIINLKTQPTDDMKPLLETTFDEHTVYEQVKFFRNSVTEVNQMLDNERRSNLASIKHKKSTGINQSQSQNNPEKLKATSNLHSNMDQVSPTSDMDDEKPFYENVELRRPQSVYENILGEDMRSAYKRHENEDRSIEDKEDLDSLEMISDSSNTMKFDNLPVDGKSRCSSSNFSVKELANKFETSPVGQQPVFDFGPRSSIKKKQHTTDQPLPLDAKATTVANANNDAISKNSNTSTASKDKLTSTQKITRSLDENAFVREFDSRQLRDSFKSAQQFPDQIEFSKRCKSVDFMRPKTLNPPKRLPGMAITEETCNKAEYKTSSRKSHRDQNYKTFCNQKVLNEVSPQHENDCESSEIKVNSNIEGCEEQSHAKMSPTDVTNSNASSIGGGNNLKGLHDVKLSRERIDKYKEERRQQLTQKYRGESFKSKSKSELNCCKDDDKPPELLQFKSKSRGDLSLLKETDQRASGYGNQTGSVASNIEQYLHGRAAANDDQKNQNFDTTKTMDVLLTSQSKRNSTEKLIRAIEPRVNMEFVKTASGTTTAGASVANGTDNPRDRWSADAVAVGVADKVDADNSRNSFKTRREKISPQFSIRNMTAMFESRSKNPE